MKKRERERHMRHSEESSNVYVVGVAKWDKIWSKIFEDKLAQIFKKCWIYWAVGSGSSTNPEQSNTNLCESKNAEN